MKCVYSTVELVQADLVQSILRRSGIDSRLQNDGSALYGIGLPGPVLLEIMVREEDLGRAATALQDALPPEPSAPKETEPGTFERKVARSARVRSWMWIAALVIPGTIVTIALGLAGDWEPAARIGALVAALAAVGFLVDRAARRARRRRSDPGA